MAAELAEDLEARAAMIKPAEGEAAVLHSPFHSPERRARRRAVIARKEQQHAVTR